MAVLKNKTQGVTPDTQVPRQLFWKILTLHSVSTQNLSISHSLSGTGTISCLDTTVTFPASTPSLYDLLTK